MFESNDNAVPACEDRRIFPNALYTSEDVQRLLNVSERTVRSLPRLRWIRFGRKKMVMGDDLIRLIRNRR